jgi:iron-sulfur cluster assembly accessory protein
MRERCSRYGNGEQSKMLKLTEKAVDKVKQLMLKEDKEGHGLRVAVQGGGCSGFQYGLTYEKEKTENDQVLEFDGLQVYVDAMSLLHLEDVTIDYVEGLSGAGFKIENPKATGTCGCGASFSM